MAEHKKEQHNIGKVVETAAWSLIAIWAGALILDAADVSFSL
jgi:hypothetical protein